MATTSSDEIKSRLASDGPHAVSIVDVVAALPDLVRGCGGARGSDPRAPRWTLAVDIEGGMRRDGVHLSSHASGYAGNGSEVR